VLVAVAIGAILALGASAASAVDPRAPGGPADPQTTNVPQTAWTGQSVRLVKCFPAKPHRTDEELGALGLSGLTGNFVLEDWSGQTLPVSASPRFLTGNTSGDATDAVPFLGHRKLCFAAVVTSQKPGLAVIKLAINETVRGSLIDFFDGFAESTVIEHQFLAIWMHMTKPSIEELPYGGDKEHLNVWYLDKSNEPGRIRVQVKGTFPLGNNFSGMMPGDVVTLPDHWSALADRFSVDKWNPLPGSVPLRWDIHDDNAPPPANVTSLWPKGPYDTVNGLSSNWVVGPFDPIHPFSTLLSNGATDAYDAPMPAARVDVSIKNNSGNNGDVSGAGKLVPVAKTDVYNAGGVYYAPYYSQYIPATTRGADASGTHSGYGNNFPTLLVREYDNWQIVDDKSNRTDGSYRCRDELGKFRPAPNENKPQGGHVVVFTDEHGEAIIGFDPDGDYGNFYHVIDVNNRCDLDRLPGRIIGTAEVRAQAIYPGQPVFNVPSTLSDPLYKVIKHGASKTLDCVAKSPIESFCVETIKDIYGRPVAGAPVEFSRTPVSNGIRADSIEFGGYDTRGQYVIPEKDPFVVRIKTNHLGQAGVVIVHTLREKVDLLTENKGTRLDDTGGTNAIGVLRVRCIQFYGDGSTMPTSAGSCELPPAGAQPGGALVIGGPVSVATSSPKAKVGKMRLAWVKFVKTKYGKRVQIRIVGPKKSALVRFTLLGKGNKVMKVVHRKVVSGRAVTINLKLTGARKVRVALLR
jgi:hypothetical protein